MSNKICLGEILSPKRGSTIYDSKMRPWRRTNTGDSTLVGESASRRRNTIPFDEASTAGRVQDRYPAYEDFPWEKIKEYLLQKWPNWTGFNEARVSHVVVMPNWIERLINAWFQVGDSWQFEVPEKLTDVSRLPRGILVAMD